MANNYPRICFAGPMIGRNPGQVTTQGEILSDGFSKLGYPVICVSSHPNRYMRLLDIAMTIIRRRAEIDILIVHIFGGPSFVVEDIASLLGKLFGMRIIMLLQGGALPDFMARWPNWTKRVLSRADVFVAPSTYLAKAVEPYGFTSRVHPNVIDLSDYPYRHRQRLEPKLFWMRSFHDVWNPLMAIRVLAKLRQHVPNASLSIAGQDKGLQEATRQLAQDLGLNGSVRFPGFLNMKGKAAEGDSAEIYINTNRIDNMPIAVVEACAMGLPVVATNVGGIPDLLTEGETGLMVPDDDDEQMTQAILRLLDDPDLAGRLSANGRKLAEESSWTQVQKQWTRLFDELMQKTPRR